MSKLAASLFVSDAVHERTVTLEDGTEHVLYFKEVSAVEFRKFHIAERSDDEDVRAGSMAKLIAASLCDATGKPALTLKQALTLKTGPANAIASAVLEVNGIGERGKASTPGAKTGSGKS